MANNRRYNNNNNNYNMNMTTSMNRLSDRDIMLDLISTEKHLSHLYEHAVMESTNVTVHNAMEEFQHDEHETAYTLFSAMQDRGWYNTAGQNQNTQFNGRKNFNVKSNKRNNAGGNRGRSYSNQYQYS